MTRDRNSSSSICVRTCPSFQFPGLSPAGIGASSESPTCSSRSSWVVSTVPGYLLGLAAGGSRVGSSHDCSDNSLYPYLRADTVMMFDTSPHCADSLRSGVIISIGFCTAYGRTGPLGSRRGNLEQLEGRTWNLDPSSMSKTPIANRTFFMA